ncbi:unnamed protein product, partial [Staurois parvus]
MRGPGRADIVNAGSGESGYSDLDLKRRTRSILSQAEGQV